MQDDTVTAATTTEGWRERVNHPDYPDNYGDTTEGLRQWARDGAAADAEHFEHLADIARRVYSALCASGDLMLAAEFMDQSTLYPSSARPASPTQTETDA